MTMSGNRWLDLMHDDEPRLTSNELAEGWHFCPEWDDLLIGPGMGETESCLCESNSRNTT